jgi:hypothetical protein
MPPAYVERDLGGRQRCGGACYYTARCSQAASGARASLGEAGSLGGSRGRKNRWTRCQANDSVRRRARSQRCVPQGRARAREAEATAVAGRGQTQITHERRCGLTFELTGTWKPPEAAVAFPVQRRVRPHCSAHLLRRTTARNAIAAKPPSTNGMP